MTPAEFDDAVRMGRVPGGVPMLVRALWHDATGDWETAHALAQEVDSPDGAWVHAYLHRREGDHGNAAYWYGRAGRLPASGALDDERRAIVAALLGPR